MKAALAGAAAMLLAGGGPAAAQTVGFVANPTTNSSDWATAVGGLGGSINSNVTFDTHPLGGLNGAFYTASDGVTMATTGGTSSVKFGAGPAQLNTSTGPVSPGEGAHAASNYLEFDNTGPSTLTISFSEGVVGAGFFLVDLFNPGSQPAGRNAVQIQAFDGVNGTGSSLGLFDAAQFNFQQNGLYFMGVTNSDAAIRSIRLINPAGSSDIIGVDNIRFATRSTSGVVPEPVSLALMLPGLAALTLLKRGRRGCV
jgi:hypothetical protein